MKLNFSKLINSRKASDGFTLIELLTAMAISSIVIGMTGYGVVALTDKSNKEKAETEKRVELNRAQDFISDEVRTASNVSSSTPNWANDNDKTDAANSSNDWIQDLGGGSPSAKLYLQIPLKVASIDAANKLTITKHGFSGGNAVTFTGSGVTAAGLIANTVYYVRKDPQDDYFRVSTTIADAKHTDPVDTKVVSLSAVTPGSLTVNRLVIYYTRDNTPTWLGPKTVNRSAGPCSYSNSGTNCPVLVDSIAATNGFTATVTSSRKADITLLGVYSATKNLKVSNNAFARLFEVLGGADTTPGGLLLKTAEDAKKVADDAATTYTNYVNDELKKAQDAAKTAVDLAKTTPTAANYTDAAKKADLLADAETQAAKLATAAQIAADKAATAYTEVAANATSYGKADKAAEYKTLADKYDAATYPTTTHDTAATTATANGDKYDIASTKYATAEASATTYTTAKNDATTLQIAANNAAIKADTTKTAADYTAAATAASNYAIAEGTTAGLATTAQNDLNSAANYATGSSAPTVYNPTPHTTAANTANQNAANYTTLAQAATVREATNSIFTTKDGVITFNKLATGSFKIIGGDSGGIPVTTTVNQNGSTTGGTPVIKPASGQTPQTATVIAPAGTTLTVTGRADSLSAGGVNYGGFNANSSTNLGTQVWALRNGDTLPPFTPYPGQDPPATYLTAAGLLVNGKIKIADNQVIYLFEVTTTNRTRNDYDIQDIIVLATIEATVVPAAPTITATVSNKVVTLSWSAVTHATSYELYRYVAATKTPGTCTPSTVNNPANLVNSNAISGVVTSSVSTGVSSTQKVCFAVKAKNSLGTSALSNILSYNNSGGTQAP